MENEAVIDPRMFIEYIAKERGVSIDDLKLPKIGILVFNSRMLEYMIERFNARYKPWLYRSQLKLVCNPYVANIDGKDVVFILPGWGAPSTITVMEEMIACSTNTFIALGLYGTIAEGLNIGEVVIVKDAIIDEGNSRHYIPGIKVSRSDTKLLELVENVCRNLRVKYHIVRIWSTDAPYRETIDKVLKFRSLGASCVDMETSAIYTVASYRGVKAVAIHIVSDDLSKLKWKPAFKKSIDETVATIEKILIKLIEKL